jgi:hypothetical protein
MKVKRTKNTFQGENRNPLWVKKKSNEKTSVFKDVDNNAVHVIILRRTKTYLSLHLNTTAEDLLLSSLVLFFVYLKRTMAYHSQPTSSNALWISVH